MFKLLTLVLVILSNEERMYGAAMILNEVLVYLSILTLGFSTCT